MKNKAISVILIGVFLIADIAHAADCLAPSSEVGAGTSMWARRASSKIFDKRIDFVLERHHLKRTKANRRTVKEILGGDQDRDEQIQALRNAFQLGRSEVATFLNEMKSQEPIPQRRMGFKGKLAIGAILAALTTGTGVVLQVADVVHILPTKGRVTIAPSVEQVQFDAPAYPVDQEMYRSELLKHIEDLIKTFKKANDPSLQYLDIFREGIVKTEKPFRELDSSLSVAVVPDLGEDRVTRGIKAVFLNGEIFTKLMARANTDPTYLKILEAHFIKEAGTIEEMMTFPLGFKGELDLYNEWSRLADELIAKGEVKPKEDLKLALQHPRLKAIIKEIVAMRIHKEYAGYVRFLQYLISNGVDRPRLIALRAFEEDSTIRKAVLSEFSAMMWAAVDENKKIDEWALKVFFFDGLIKNIEYSKDPIVVRFFLLALGIEWAEGDAIEGADGIIRMRLDSERKPVRSFLDYLTDPKYYRPVSEKMGMEGQFLEMLRQDFSTHHLVGAML